jgi:hypothetical protein
MCEVQTTALGLGETNARRNTNAFIHLQELQRLLWNPAVPYGVVTSRRLSPLRVA